MSKNVTILMLTVLLLTGVCLAQKAPSERWSAQKAKDWYARQPWLVGCNFVPSTAINQLEMWQADTFDPETIDRELGWAADIGMNTLRVFLHDMLWTQDSEGFVERIDLFLDICKKHKIKPMFVLFDSVWDPHPKLGKQPAPKPHVHNSGWVQSPHIDVLKDPAKQDALEAYVKGVIGKFKDDPRVLIWDLYNEPGNTNGNSYGKHEPKNKDALCLTLLEKAFVWARQVNPSQPLTAGIWTGSWEKDHLPPLNRVLIDQSDVISFHTYSPLDRATAGIDLLKSYGRPLICTEYMARTAGSSFQDYLPYLKEHKIGAYNWGLVAGKTQTQYPWQSWTESFTAEPDVWFHEIFRPDGSPYVKAEAKLFKKLTADNAKVQEPPVVEQEKKLQNPVVKMITNKGEIQIELDVEKAPISVANFLKYSESDFYNGTIFHRVIKDFMIQGGGMTSNMQEKKTKPPIKNESDNGLRNNRGTIAMARTNAPDSATSQFYINHKDNPFLNGSKSKPGYAVFGKVIKGMEVVDEIAAVLTRKVGSHGTVPVEPVAIKSVTVIKAPDHENHKEGHDEHKGHDKDGHEGHDEDEHEGHDEDGHDHEHDGDHDKSEHDKNDNN
jgi:cyclophilin family peptidyl-prolyl cis-trans isomerase